MTTRSPFKYFKTSHEIIRLAVMYYVRYSLSFRQVEISCMSVELIFATKQCYFGSTDLAHYLRLKSVETASIEYAHIRRQLCPHSRH